MSIRQPYPSASSLSIGGTVSLGTAGSVLFINPANILAQDNANLSFTDDSTLLFKLGSVSTGGQAITTIKGGILSGSSATESFLNITGTFPAVTTNTTYGALIDVTGAGSSAFQQRALRVVLQSGYTGSSATAGIQGNNFSQGTGISGWTGGSANYGITYLASTAATTTGHRVVMWGSAAGSSSMNAGALFNSISSDATPALNLGVGTLALGGTANVGGFFGLMNTAPTLATSSAIIGDNGTTGSDIFQARINGVVTTKIDGSGNLNVGTLTASKLVFTDASKNLTSTGIGTSGQFLKADGSLDSTVYGSGTVTSVATNSTLTGGPITTTGTLGLNLSNANTWTALQTLQASSATTNIPVVAGYFDGRTSGTPVTGQGVEVDFATKLINSSVGYSIPVAYIQAIPAGIDTTASQFGSSFSIWGASNFLNATSKAGAVYSKLVTFTSDPGAGIKGGINLNSTVNDGIPITRWEVGGNLYGVIDYSIHASQRSTGSFYSSLSGAGIGFSITDAASQIILGGVGAQSEGYRTTTQADLVFSVLNNNVFTEQMRLLGSGNLGIGIVNPVARLHLAAGTASNSPIKFTLPGVLLTTPQLGVLETDASKLYYTETSLIRKSLSGVIFTQTADKAVTNTVTETSIVGTGVGYGLTLPTNFFVAGKSIRIKMSGVYSTVSVTGDIITVKVKYGSTVIATKATSSLLAGATGLYWEGEILVTCRTTGATGTVMTSGSLEYSITTVGGVAKDELNNGGATTTIDTTTANLLDITVTHSAANASNSVTSVVSSWEILN